MCMYYVRSLYVCHFLVKGKMSESEDNYILENEGEQNTNNMANKTWEKHEVLLPDTNFEDVKTNNFEDFNENPIIDEQIILKKINDYHHEESFINNFNCEDQEKVKIPFTPENNSVINIIPTQKLESFESNEQTLAMDSILQKDSQKLENESSESENMSGNYFPHILDPETHLNSSGDNYSGFENVNSSVTSITSKSLDKEIINNQLIVLEPNNPIMMRFQNTLKKHLLKQRDNIKQELITLDGSIKSKQNEKDEFINEMNNIASQVESQRSLLNDFHHIKIELETAKVRIESYIDQGKLRYAEMLTKITAETKKFAVLKRQLDFSQELLNELSKYENEQELTFNMCHKKKSQTKQYKKKLLNEQQKQDLLLLSLTQEILRMEDRMKQLGEQAETKYNERELLKQKVVDSSIDLDALNGDNAKITLLWNDVLISIQQRDKSFQKIKIDYQEAKNQYQLLLMKANSYKRSAQEEFHKYNDLLNFLNKLKQEKIISQKNFKLNLDKYYCLKDEHSKLIQITEFQHQNLCNVISNQKQINNEIEVALHLLEKKSNQKLKYEELVVNELKKQLFTNSSCIQMNKKISELKSQNKEHELMLVEIENNLSQALLKLEQYRTTSFNLEKDIEENNKYLTGQVCTISECDFEFKKILADIQYKLRQIDIETKQLEIVKKRHDDGYTQTPQMKIDQMKNKIEEINKEADIMRNFWVQKQNKNIQLINQRNEKSNELNKVRKYTLVMNMKSVKLEQEVVSLSKEIDNYKRALTYMRNTISKLNENFSQNKGKCNQLLNENEWIHCSYLIELKENEKQCLDYMDQLKSHKNELSEIKNIYIEKERENKSWDSKIKLLIEMKKEIQQKDGDLGDIDAMKNEIHRMQIRESQLKKMLEKIMLDLEVCISRREMIYNKVAAKDIRLKGKNETKQKFLKKLDNLGINIKNIKIECKKLDRIIRSSQYEKMELECKLTTLNDKLIQIEENINDLNKKIEDIGVTKIKNIHNLSYKQNHAKFLDDVKKGKYRLLIKSESKINEEYSTEWKKNSDLISVVEALKNDFPYLDFQITRLINILKTINN